MHENFFTCDISKYIGQTVTIFTTSGGVSGCGFTGVLAAVTENTVRLITSFGAAPSCPLGSACGDVDNNNVFGNDCGCGNGNNWLGSVTEIPVDRIAGFTHNAI